MDATANFYSRPSYHGGSFPVYSGSRRQRGGGILGALARIALPMAKRFGTAALRTAKREGLKLGANVVSDLAQGRNIKDSLLEHGKAAATNVGKKTLRTAVKTIAPQKRRQQSASKQKSKRPRSNPQRIVKKKKTRRNF